MSQTKLTLEDLLAVRDGEPVEAKVVDAVQENADYQRAIATLKDVREQLRQLPDIPLDDHVWQSAAQHKVANKSAWLRFPLATAAVVCLVSAVTIVQLTQPTDTSPTEVVQPQLPHDSGFQLAGLMAQSRDLEQRLYADGSSALNQADASAPEQGVPVRPNPAGERALRFRLADVDAQIAALYEQPQMDDMQRLRLWQQRVSLLRSLLALRGQGEQTEALRNL